jgi:spermidine synthase
VRRAFILSIFISGLSAMVAQILLLRELLISFHGNELTVGIILANWVALEALGALFLGRSVDKIKNKLQGFVWLLLIFSIAFPVALYLSRTLKEALNIPAGAGMGFGWIFLSSFLILLPLSLSHGALFTFGCRIYHLLVNQNRTASQASRFSQPSRSVGRVYASETLGTIAGGVIFTYLFIRYFNSFQIAFVIALLNLILCLILLNLTPSSGRALKSFATVLFVISLYLVFSAGVNEIHQFSINRQWRNFKVLDYQNSIYGNVVAARMDSQHSFFSNGVPVLTAPYPDIAFVEEFGNIPLLFHPRPRDMLIISSGAGGLINEALKHPLRNIDYLEIDPLILKMVRKYPTPLTESELADKRVNVKNLDGRFFVNKTDNTYDLILIGASEPSDLQINRLFTEEFFSLAKKRLNERGLIAFSLSGSSAYLSRQLRDVNACILNGLKKVYGYVRIIPGDNNLFLASDCEDILTVGPDLIIERITSRSLKTNLLSLPYLEHRFSRRRLDWFLDMLKGATYKTNKDFRPLAVFKYSSYWNAQFSPYLNGFLEALEKIDLKICSILILILTGGVFLIRSISRRFNKVSIPFCIFATGFFGMLINLVLIFGFQITHGYLYYQIGILLTAFMAGIASGSILMTRSLDRIKRDYVVFLSLEFLIILLAMIIPLVIAGFPKFIFLVFCFMAGALVGSEFPLANKMYLAATKRLAAGAGLLYGFDLLGGWLAGMLGGVAFLPILGIFGTCLTVVMLKVGSLIVLVLSRNEINN